MQLACYCIGRLLNQRASLATVLMGDVKNMQAKKQPINDVKNKWQPTTERDISSYATFTTELSTLMLLWYFSVESMRAVE